MPIAASTRGFLASVGSARKLADPARLRGLFAQSADRGRERYRRAGITASTSFISKALTIVISLVSVPLTVHYLGGERYGVWLTISSLLTWMAMTDFGIAGNALVNVLSEAHGRDDHEQARRYSSSAFWALSAIAFALGLALAAAFPFIPWRTVFRVSDAVPTAELNWACALSLLFFVVALPLSVLNSIYNAYQDGFVMNLWGIASNVLALLGLVVVTQFHGGLPYLVFAISGIRLAVQAVNAYFLFFRHYRWLAPKLGAVRWSCVHRLLSLGSKYLVTQLASLGIYQSQPMIITQLLGPSQVVIFVVAQKIVTLPNDLVYMATAPLISAYGEARARHDWQWIRGAFRNSTLASLAFGVPVMAVIALTAKPVIRAWAGPAAVPGTPLVIWLCIYTLFGIALMGAGQLMCGVERLNALAVSLTLCALAVVGSSLLFAPRWGVTGVGFAMALSKAITFWPIQTFEVRRIFRGSRGEVSATAPAAA